MNEYFQTGSVPAPSSPGTSGAIRSEFASIAAAFDKLPVMAGSPNEFVVINATGTALISAGFVFADLATVTGSQTLINKTLSWAGNTWLGFGTGATKDAGTGANQVLLLAENNTLPAMDAGHLTNIPGLSLKADANNAILTGAPVGPTPGTGDNSPRLATTMFVNDAVAAVGGATPSNALPLMDGVAAAGAALQVSRDNHVHPSDTSRAPASAATAAGTSFTPAGTIAASTVQAAIAELDTDNQIALALKANLASPTFTGDPRAPTTATSDNDTSIATTAFVQALLAQQPPGTAVSNAIPGMNGIAAAGVGIEASRFDHIHPIDTSRASIASPTFTGTVGGITKTMVGLPNVDNTTDASKPVSTAQQAALDLKVTQTSATGYALIPAGNTAQGNAGYTVGALRFNSETVGWEGWNGTNRVPIGGGQMLGQALVKGIFFNSQTIAENLTVAAGTNGLSAGPITINDGFAVTVADGACWSIT